MTRWHIACALVLVAAASARADENPLEVGLERFEARDFAAARAPLEAAHRAAPHDLAVDLLLGITDYRLGRDAAARPLLEAAARAPDKQSVASARIFLGLLARRRGNEVAARHLWERAASEASGGLAAGARALLGEPAARWRIELLAAPGYDSNVELLPQSAQPGVSGADAHLFLLGSASYRPAAGLTLADTASLRKQATLTDFDLLFDNLQATWSGQGARDRLTVGDRLEGGLLGGAPYLAADIAEAAWWHTFTDGGAGAGLRYTFAARDYFGSDWSGYSGLAHTAVLEAGWQRGADSVTAGGIALREGASDPALAAVGGGVRADLRLVSGGTAFVGAASAVERVFDSGGRVDLQLRADATLLVGVSAHVSFALGGTAITNASNSSDFSYAKLMGFAGLDIDWAAN